MFKHCYHTGVLEEASRKCALGQVRGGVVKIVKSMKEKDTLGLLEKGEICF